MYDPYIDSLGDLHIHILSVKHTIHKFCCGAAARNHIVHIAAPPLIADMVVHINTFLCISIDLLRRPEP